VKTEQRKADQLGRVMLPFKLRKKAGIKKLDLLDLKVEDEKIVITKA
jgi:bifunctional DNA-binding transcriptional regulator/antitoxin component of YhaV-PrlF toxin-antitoxin module